MNVSTHQVSRRKPTPFDFPLLLASQAATEAGNQIALITFPLFALLLTHSGAQAGLIGAIRELPYLLFCLPAGALVDRWARKRVMILCDSGRALALGTIPLALMFGSLTVGHLCVVALLEGTLFVFFNMAETAALPHLVDEAHLTSALTQNSVVASIAGVIGQSLAGALWGVAHALPFGLNALGSACSALSLAAIGQEFHDAPQPSPRGKLRQGIGEGVAWLWQHPILRDSAWVLGVLQTCAAGWGIVLIVLVQRMHGSPLALGMVFASSSVGTVLGSAGLPVVLARWRFGQFMTWGASLWGAAWLGYVMAPSLLWLSIANLVIFAIGAMYITAQYRYRISQIPDALQGRVNSVFRLIVYGGQSLGLMLTGSLIQISGPIWAVILLVVPQIVVGLVAWRWSPLRHATL